MALPKVLMSPVCSLHLWPADGQGADAGSNHERSARQPRRDRQSARKSAIAAASGTGGAHRDLAFKTDNWATGTL